MKIHGASSPEPKTSRSRIVLWVVIALSVSFNVWQYRKLQKWEVYADAVEESMAELNEDHAAAMEDILGQAVLARDASVSAQEQILFAFDQLEAKAIKDGEYIAYLEGRLAAMEAARD